MTANVDRLGEKVRCSLNSPKPYWAYVPRVLPPPHLDISRLQNHVERASQAIGRLDGAASVLPDTQLFLYMYVRKEAVMSSQIEGTQSSLSDLLMFESSIDRGVPINDVEEVSNYVAAMNYGLKQLEDGFPLSLRLIREIHEVLMSGMRGGTKNPGEFRKTQNWIGGTRPGHAKFVPPPPDRLSECLNSLEKYMHDKSDNLPVLIRAALIHHQFETIHPFLDGNGRLGRLLITMLLCAEKMISQPVLYLSLYFKTHRTEYYDQLQQVRDTGDWETWLEFFLNGVEEVSTQATQSAREIFALVQADRTKILDLGRRAGSAMRVFQHLEKKPLAIIPELVSSLKISTPTVTSALENLVELSIVRETTGNQRNRVFVYDQFLKILTQGTDPL